MRKIDKRSTEEFLAFLKETLIPDLHESGTHATAEDFERCVQIIEDLKAQLNPKPTPKPKPKAPGCPQCGQSDVGTEVKGEWYCYNCGNQWNKKGVNRA